MLKRVENEAVKEEDYTREALAREGARRMLRSALEEVAAYGERHAEARDADGRRLVVRNGQARAITWGAGTLEVRAPREGRAVPVHESDLATVSAPLARSRRSCRFCIYGGSRRGISGRH